MRLVVVTPELDVFLGILAQGGLSKAGAGRLVSNERLTCGFGRE